jgi:hypothetical protein
MIPGPSTAERTSSSFGPLTRAWVVAALVAILLQVALGALAAVLVPPDAVVNGLGLLALALAAFAGGAWYRRADPESGVPRFLMAALPVALAFAALSFGVSLDAGTSAVRLTLTAVAAVVAVLAGALTAWRSVHTRSSLSPY